MRSGLNVTHMLKRMLKLGFFSTFIVTLLSLTPLPIANAQSGIPQQDRDSSCDDIPIERTVSGLEWSLDGSLIAVASYAVDIEQCFTDVKIEIVDIRGESIFTFHKGFMPVWDIDWRPFGNELLSGDFEGAVQRWNTETGDLITSYHVSDMPINHVSWSYDGTAFASGGWDNTIRVQDMDGNVVNSLALGTSAYPGLQSGLGLVEWSPAANDHRLATSSVDGTVQIRDGSTLAPLITLRAAQARAPGLAWGPDGRKVATASSESSRVQVWDSQNGKLLRNLDGHTGSITCLDWHPDGIHLASSNVDGSVHIWNTDTGETEQIIQADNMSQITRVAWSPDGNLVYGGAAIIEGEEGEIIKILMAGTDLFLADAGSAGVSAADKGQ